MIDMEEMNITPNEELLNKTVEGQTVHPETTQMKSYSDEELATMTCSEIVDAVALMSQQDTLPQRREIDALRKAFEKKKSLYAEKKDSEQVALFEQAEIQESRLKDLLATYKVRYSQFLEEQQKEQEENFKRKSQLIERFRAIVNSNDDFETIRVHYRELIDEWKSIGIVPEAKYTELQNEYIHLNEAFYDLRKLNDDFRSYDFKKNLESKRELIERAKELSEMSDIFQASKELQDLHRQWKETGPVAKELRETIWEEFNGYSHAIHHKLQQHFDNRREQEESNLEEKKKLCETLEAIEYDKLKTVSSWSDETKKVLELQAKWKEIGHAPKGVNEEIFARYRASCDFFFKNKELFFRKLREEQSANIEAMKKIVEQAESLASSQDWNATSNKLKALQQEWKKLGHTPKKEGNELWERMRAACNTFFEAKKLQNADRNQEQSNNLNQKREIIAKIEALLAEEMSEGMSDLRERLNNLTAEFNAVGHVPFHEKEKIYKLFRATVDKVYEKFHLSRNQQRMGNYRTDIEALVESGDKRKLRDELDKLTRAKERYERELHTTTSSMDLFTSNSKWGDSMLKDIEQKQQRLGRDIDMIKEKIALVKQKMQEIKE